MSRVVFLSCVTVEAKSYRRVAANFLNEWCQTRVPHDLITPRSQEELVEQGDTTLCKLDKLISTCTHCVHLLGKRSRSDPLVAGSDEDRIMRIHVDELLTEHPDLLDRFNIHDPEVACRIPYTYWEALLARYRKVPLVVFRLGEGAPRDCNSFPTEDAREYDEHIERLRLDGVFPAQQPVENQVNFAARVIAFVESGQSGMSLHDIDAIHAAYRGAIESAWKRRWSQ